MNPAGLPYAGGQAGAFVVDAATESTAVEISTYEQFAAFAKAVNAGTAESYASVKLTADITIPQEPHGHRSVVQLIHIREYLMGMDIQYQDLRQV